MMTKDEFKNFVAERVNSHWASLTSPYLLADIPRDLREENGTDYKTVLGDQRLKAFLEETSEDSLYVVVQHPAQKAKVGLIPFGTTYEFPLAADDPSRELRSRKSHVETSVRDATLVFLEAVSKLPETEQDRIVIPTKTIANLLQVR